MAIFPSPKLIKTSDFPQENEQLITTLGNILNSTLERIYEAMNQGIDFNNLNQSLLSFNVIVNSNGIPTSDLELKSTLKTKIQGVICIRVQGDTTPTTNPLVSFNYSSSTNSIKVSHITGLVPGKTYNLTVILIG
jgi:hypothetical protein